MAVIKATYDAGVDVLRIKLSTLEIDHSDEIVPGIIIDYTKYGVPVGIEILDYTKEKDVMEVVKL